MPSLRVTAALLCALPFLVGAPSPAAAGGAPDLGTSPPDCGAVHRDYADPSCTTQTRNGTFSLSPHVVHAGGTLTGTIGARCMHRNGVGFDQPPNELCPIDWNELLAIGKRKSGCTPAAGFCTVKISKRAPQTKYTILTVGITSDQGTGISKDYYAIIGGDYYVLAGHVTDENAKPAHGVFVTISGPVSRSKRTEQPR